MTEQYNAAGKFLPAVIFQLSTNLADIRNLHKQLTLLGEDDAYIPRQVVMFNEPVEQARERLGKMVENLGRLRSEAEYIQAVHRETLEKQYPGMAPEQIDAMNHLGCEPFLREVARMEQQYADYVHPREPQTSDVSGLSVKRAAPRKDRERSAN